MSRYDEIFNIKSAKDVVASIDEIPTMDSDLYITYNSSDRLDLISNRVYGDPKYWWLILAANGYQIEFDIPVGEIIRIPYPLSNALSHIRNVVNGTR